MPPPEKWNFPISDKEESAHEEGDEELSKQREQIFIARYRSSKMAQAGLSWQFLLLVFPILQMMLLRPRAVKQLAQE